jgi:hypothetical protein
MTLAATVGVEHVMSLVAAVGCGIVLARVVGHCEDARSGAGRVKSAVSADNQKPQVGIARPALTDGKDQVREALWQKRRNEGGEGEPVEMQRRTLLCSRRLAFMAWVSMAWVRTAWGLGG